MGIAGQLAARIAALRFDDLPELAVEQAKIAILDTVGVTLAGSQEDCARIAEAAIEPAPGPCLIYGHDRRVASLDAALINGTAAHALDYDDCNNTMGGHPSAVVLPGLLALAEAEDAGGRDVLTAYLAGYETVTKIGRGVNFHHYEKGWHPTATLGVFGSAAAAARLMRLSESETEMALALAVSFASGVKANFGTMTKPLHVGHCARNGLFAARLARQGFTASPDAFDHGQGFFEVFNGAGNYDPDRIFEVWADPLDILDPGIAIKAHPCCGSTHPAIDAMMNLVRDHGLTPERVAAVHVQTHSRRLRHTNRPDPRSPLDAKFSVQYAVARALMQGRVRIEDFEGDAHDDPAARAVMQRITAEPHHDPDNHFSAAVNVTTTDGETLRKYVLKPLGRDITRPLPPEILRAKFEDCAARALPADRIAPLHDALMDLENVRGLRDLTAIISPAAVGQAAE